MRAQGLVALKARHGHIQNGLQALRVNALDDVRADPGLDRLAHDIRVVFVSEHDDGPWLVAADQDDLFHDIPAR
ncbi:hypothetical protein D3C80_2114760 [compost metagenome]